MRCLRVAVTGLALLAQPASAHFLEILPSADVLPNGGAVALALVFTHPMERGPVMDLAKPKRVGKMIGGAITDLTDGLRPQPMDGKTGWRLTDTLDQPGAAVYFIEPQPYWDGAEKKWISHYAKVIVDSYASGQGWAQKIGLPVEIEPLTRPTGLWTGMVFRGIVRADGKPVPFADVEIEWVNDGSIQPPNDAFITQVTKTDQNGVFVAGLPRAGWWGFAAVIDGPDAHGPKGEAGKTELGGLMWVKATDIGAAAPPAIPPAK